MTRYTLFVDESGDAGIETVRAEGRGGASPYMTLGAALVPSEHFEEYRGRLTNICREFDKDILHCQRLKHFQKIHYCRRVAEMDIQCFGLISLKSTLGWYRDTIDQDSKKYYNICARLLLECLGDYMASNGLEPHQVDVVFENGNFNYEKLRNYIRVCQNTPKGLTSVQRERVKLLRKISADRITATPKIDEPLLQLADLVAHSLYKCVDKSNACFHITEPRYLVEIAELFYRCVESGAVIGRGIKPVHTLGQLRLDENIRIVFSNLNGR